MCLYAAILIPAARTLSTNGRISSTMFLADRKPQLAYFVVGILLLSRTGEESLLTADIKAGIGARHCHCHPNFPVLET